MKKVFGLMLGMLLVVSLAGCGGKKNDMQSSAEKTAGVSSTKEVSKSTVDDKTLSANMEQSIITKNFFKLTALYLHPIS